MNETKISKINGYPIIDTDLTDEVNDIKRDFNEKVELLNGRINAITGETTDNNVLDTFKEVESKLNTKANISEVYSKNDMDNLLSEKIASENVYTKEDINSRLTEITNDIASKNTALTEKIELKADASELAALKEKVNLIAGTDEAYDTIEELKTLVDTKANATDTETKLETKLNKSDFDTFKSENTAALNAKVNTSDFDSFKTENAANLDLKATKEELNSTKEAFEALKNEVTAQHYEVEFTIGSASRDGFESIIPASGSANDPEVSTKGNTKILCVDGVVSKSGNQKFNGQGDFTYTLNLRDGYRLVRTKIDGDYEKLEVGPKSNKDGTVELAGGQFRIKNIHSDIDIELILSNKEAYVVTFPEEVLEKCKIVIYTGNDFTEEYQEYSGPFSIISDGFCFKIIPNDGYSYTFERENIEGTFTNLKSAASDKYPADCFNITKIGSNLTVTPVFTKIEKTLADYAIKDAYTKQETEEKINEIKSSIPKGAYVYKGTVANLDALKAVENPSIGDVYNVESAGVFKKNINYAWTGEGKGDTDGWDSLGSSVDVDLTDYYTKSQTYSREELDTKLNAKVESSELTSALEGKADKTSLNDYCTKAEFSAKIPDVPEGEGTYILKAVKTTSGITYSWVAETPSN